VKCEVLRKVGLTCFSNEDSSSDGHGSEFVFSPFQALTQGALWATGRVVYDVFLEHDLSVALASV